MSTFFFEYYCTWNFIIHGAQELRRVNNINFLLHKDEFDSFLKWCFMFLYFCMLDFSLLVLKNCWFFLFVIMKVFQLFVLFFVGTKKVSQKIGSSIWSLCCGTPSSNSKLLHYKCLWDIKWWLCIGLHLMMYLDLIHFLYCPKQKALKI